MEMVVMVMVGAVVEMVMGVMMKSRRITVMITVVIKAMIAVKMVVLWDNCVTLALESW